MSEMIERVARAIYFAGERISDPFSSVHDAHWAHWWMVDREEHEAMARAAIAAMRGPSEMMENHIREKLSKLPDGKKLTGKELYDLCIDCALL